MGSRSGGGEEKHSENNTAPQRQKAVTLFLVENEFIIFLGHSRHPLSCG